MAGWIELICHPETPSAAIERLDFHLHWPSGGEPFMHFRVHGRTKNLLLPSMTDSARVNGLWQHTCFELFAGDRESAAYVELNFSPSTQWAAYAFSGYRQDMRTLALPEEPVIARVLVEDQYIVSVSLRWPEAPVGREGIFAPAAVIEEIDGTKSYWALAHPPSGPPDFHDPACFMLELAPPA